MAKKYSAGMHFIVSVMREEQEKLSSGHCRLTLTPSLLSEIYTEVSESTAENGELKILCAAVQALRLVPDADNPRGCESVHLSVFPNLTYLELKGVPVNMIRDLSMFRAQLQYLVCSFGSCTCLKELLTECGGDRSPDRFLWDELQSLTLTKTSNLAIDTSLSLTHWLRFVDLSCNTLQDDDITNLNALESLEQLDCGYNVLQAVPRLNSATSVSLKILNLRHNFIEKLNGLEHLCSLEELDLTYNCIADPEVLSILGTLPKLTHLSLLGNPVAYMKDYRNLTLQFISGSVNRRFLLDNQPITKKEREFLGLKAPPPSLLLRPAVRINPAFTPEEQQQQRRSPPPDTVHSTGSLGTPSSFKLTPRRQGSAKRRLREAEIVEAGAAEDTTPLAEVTGTEEEHLATKQKLEELRRTFGDSDWLHSQAGTQVSELLGWSRDTVASKYVQLEEELFKTGANGGVQTGEETEGNPREGSIAVLSSDLIQSETRNIDSMESSGIGLQEETSEDEDEAGQHVFVVQHQFKGTSLERILTVSLSTIREKDALTGQTISVWRTSSLEAVTLLNRDPQVSFTLQFSAGPPSLKDRIYIMEENDFSEFESLISSLVEVNCPSVTNELLHCVRCNNEFPKSQAPVKLRAARQGHEPQQISVCPQCGSEMIFTLEDDIRRGDSVVGASNTERVTNDAESECSVEVIDQSLAQKLTTKKTTDSVSSVTSKASSSLPSLPYSSILYSYADFTQVDHRLRLFCEMSVMLEVSEEFFGLIKGGVLTTSETEQAAILVVTSHRFYILKITGSESEQPDKWLQKVASYRLNQLCCLMTILGHQGFILQFNKDSSLFLYLFLLRDERRTKNFLQFFSEIMERMRQKKSLVDLSSSQKSAIERLARGLLPSDPEIEEAAAVEETDSEEVTTFVMCCTAETVPSRILDSGCAIFISAEDISLITGDCRWLLSHRNRLETWNVAVAASQPITNLISVESFVSQPEKLRLYFLDETSGLKEEWTFVLETRECVDQLVDALRSPWEAIFSVELDVNEVDE